MTDPTDLVARPLLGMAVVVGVVVALVATSFAVRWFRTRLHWSSPARRMDGVMRGSLVVGAVAGVVAEGVSASVQRSEVDDGLPVSSDGALPLLSSAAMAVAGLDVFRRRRRDAMRALLGGQVPDAPAPDVVALRRLLLARARHFDPHRAEHERRRLLPIGMDGDELVSIEITPGRRVVIGHDDIAATRAVLRHLANVVATAPWLENVRVVTFGFGPHDVVDSDRIHFAPTADVAWATACALAESNSDLAVVFVDASGATNMEHRSPDVSVLSLAVDGSVPGDADTDVLLHGTRGWRLAARSRPLLPFAADPDDVATLKRGIMPEPAKALRANAITHPWTVMVQLLGPLQAVDRDGAPLNFEKSKSLEFLAWLCMHPDRPTPIGARTALWEGSVRDSTFNNIVSDLRRALHAVSGDDVKWPRRLTTNRYELGPHVVTDVDLLLDAIAAAEATAPREAVRLICDRLANVRGMPFEGMVSDWADAEGITSNLVMIVVAAASLAARLALTLGDDEAALLATSHGLRMLPGHEELVSLRLLVHERRGEHGAARMYRSETAPLASVRNRPSAAE